MSLLTFTGGDIESSGRRLLGYHPLEELVWPAFDCWRELMRHELEEGHFYLMTGCYLILLSLNTDLIYSSMSCKIKTLPEKWESIF